MKNISTLVRSLWSNGKGWVLAIVVFGWFLSLGSRLVFPAVLPYFRDEFALTNSTAGLVITLLWLGYALTQFPGGLLSDKYGEMRVLALSSLFGFVSLLFVFIAPNFFLFVFATMLYGLGSGLFATPRVTVLTKLYTDIQGTVLGITYAGGNVGTTVLPAATGLLAVYFSWRVGFGVLVPLFLILFIAIIIVDSQVEIPNQTTNRESTEKLSHYTRTIKTVAGDPVISITAVMLLSSFAYQGLIGFYPTYLIDVKQVNPETAALIYALFFACGIGAQLLAGGVSDRIGKGNTIVIITLINGSGLVFLTLTSSVFEIIVATIILSISLGIWPVTGAYAVAALPPEVEGSAFGLLRTIFLSVAATSPFIVGLLFDSGLFDAAFIGLAGAALLATGISYRMQVKYDIA